jgi:hypothetical protein
MMSTFGKVRFGATGNGVAPLSTGLPPAMYPGAIATNQQLVVAVNRLQTMLAVALGATDTQMIVQSGIGIVPSCLLTIDNEIVQVLSGSANTWQISRGFDGTAAAFHLSNALVSGFVDAWHHNALVSEVQAVQTALGPNLSNIASTLFESISSYAFSGISIAANLTAGIANVINVPAGLKGVAGTNTNYWVRIVDPTGGNDIARVSGGSATSGNAGTLLITPQLSHTSGNWTLATASAGILELWWSKPPNGYVGMWVPAQVNHVFCNIILDSSRNLAINGIGPNESLIEMNKPDGDTLNITGWSALSAPSVQNIGFLPAVNRTSGTELYISNTVDATVTNVRVFGGAGTSYNGFTFKNFALLNVSGISAEHYTNDGLQLFTEAFKVSGGVINGLLLNGNPGVHAINISNLASSAAVAGLSIVNFSVQSGAYSYYIDPAGGFINEIQLASGFFGNADNTAVYMGGTGSGDKHIWANVLILPNPGGAAFYANQIYRDCRFTGVMAYAVGNVTKVTLDGVTDFVLDSWSIGSGEVTPGANNWAVSVLSTVQPTTNLTISNSYLGFAVTQAGQTFVSKYGLVVSAAAHVNLQIVNTKMAGTTLNFVDANTNVTKYLGFCEGLTNVVQQVASAATTVFPRVSYGGTLEITGSTGITAVSGLYAGQMGSIKTVSAVPFTAGATIGTTVTTAPNTLTPFWFDGTKLWL